MHPDTPTTPSIPTPSPPRRALPWPPVAVGALLLLALLLSTALWANQTLRGRVGPDAAPVPTTSPPTLTPVAAVPAPTSTSPPAALPTPVPTSSTAWWNWRGEVSPDLRDEIWSAYLKYWQVVADAHLTLDSSKLKDVSSGEVLLRAEAAVDELRSSGKAQEVKLEHNGQIMFATSDQAVVYDEYLSKSIFVEVTTGHEIEDNDPYFLQQISFLMNRINGNWKVTNAVRYN